MSVWGELNWTKMKNEDKELCVDQRVQTHPFLFFFSFSEPSAEAISKVAEPISICLVFLKLP